jgi:mannose-6-phosphate isomerase-like protein (cupin superfamily)
MKPEYPTAQEYAAEKAQFPVLTVVDIRAEQGAVTDAYRNQVLFDVNDDCMRLSVFEGEYRWHSHPDSDELFLVVAGELEIDFEGGLQARLTPWQCLVVPAGTVHRTRAIGRTVNVTFEKQGARTVFLQGVD